jgi:6-phosphogluconolactonase
MNKCLARLKGAAVMVLIGALIVLMSVAISSARTMVYIANADSREIYVLELNEKDGSSKVVERVAVTGSVMPLAISPDRKYLYATLRSEPFSVSSFGINPESGKLTLIKTVPLADDMAYISTDRSGRYLFGASYFGNKISVNAISGNGEVNPQPIAVIPTGKNAHCVATDASNKYLFVSNLGADLILQYIFNENSGGITPNEPAAVETKKGAGPRHFIFHPLLRFVFSTNELDGTVNAYRFDPAGTLTLVGSVSLMPKSFQGKPWAADLHVTPDGRFLYASERTSSTLAAFRINSEDGQLTRIGNYPTETQPRGFNIDPQGKYLLAVGQKSNGLSTYKIDQKTGALRKLSQMDIGKNPNWVEVIALSN